MIPMQRLWRAARLRLDLVLWAWLIPYFAARENFSGLLARIEPPAEPAYAGVAAETIVRRTRRLLRRPLLMRRQRCLREGLLAYRCLKRAGFRPHLHFGLDKASLGEALLQAHCWITLDGTMFFNPPPPGYVEIHSIGGETDAPERLGG